MTGALKSTAEREEKCRRGAQQIRRIVECMDMPGYVEAMKYVEEETSSVILPKYGDILPRNKYSDLPNKCK